MIEPRIYNDTSPRRPSSEMRRAEMKQIILPWPSPALSPNARLHWSSKAPITREARKAAWAIAKAAGVIRLPATQMVAMRMIFLPPDNRRRDMDNAIASTKAARDGIADALGVNDACFEVTYLWGEPVKGGQVVVEIAA